MKLFKNSLLMAITLVAVHGCGGSGGAGGGEAAPKTPAQAVAQLEAQGKIPSNLDRSNTLAGTDADGNGIRDDVDAHILKLSAVQQPIARQTARAVQAEILVDKTNIQAVREAALKSTKVVNCSFFRFPANNASDGKSRRQVLDEIISITTNTKPRLLAYLALSKALDGTVSVEQTGDTCE